MAEDEPYPVIRAIALWRRAVRGHEKVAQPPRTESRRHDGSTQPKPREVRDDCTECQEYCLDKREPKSRRLSRCTNYENPVCASRLTYRSHVRNRKACSQRRPASGGVGAAKMRYSGRSQVSASRSSCQPPHAGEAQRKPGRSPTSDDIVADGLRLVADDFTWRRWRDLRTGTASHLLLR